MNEFINTALSFPTVVFTILVLGCAGYWIVAVIGGFGFDGIDADSDGLDGILSSSGALAFLGLTAVPPAVAFSLVVVFAWFVSLAGTLVLDGLGVSGVVAVLVALGIAAAAVIAGSLIAAVIARPLSRLYTVVPPNQLADFVGKPCVVHTKKVTTTFGLAHVVDNEGSALLLQVRADPEEQLTLGETALVFDFDASAGTFQITRTS